MIYARSRRLMKDRAPNPGDLFALKFVGALLLFVALAVALVLLSFERAEAQAVGNVGRVGQLMGPVGGAVGGGGGLPTGTIETEAGEGLQAESGQYLVIE